jgi:hypothetical protein
MRINGVSGGGKLMLPLVIEYFTRVPTSKEFSQEEHNPFRARFIGVTHSAAATVMCVAAVRSVSAGEDDME